MKLIIAGPRDYCIYETLLEAIAESGFKPTVIVSGGAPGVDSMGERYARENDLVIARFVADWNAYGKAAGPKRNQQMSVYAHALLAIRKGGSPGTKDMIDRATIQGLQIYIKDVT